MNIAFTLHRFRYGGGERVLLTLMKELENRGHNILCITWSKEVNKGLSSNVVYFRTNNNDSKLIKYRRRLNEIKKVFRESEIDVFIAFDYDIVFYHAARCMGIRSIYSLRIDLGFMNKIKNRLIVNSLFLLANKIVFQTEKIRNSFPGIIKKKSIVIPNPILDTLPSIHENRERKIVIVARLAQEKCHEGLLNAFSKMNDLSYHLHIYGEGYLKEYLVKQANDLQISDRVHFEGRVDNIVNHIADAEILVLNSNGVEGMPNALIEGMAMGLACISTDFPSGAALDLIKDGKNGVIIPMNQEQPLIDALNLLTNNDVLRRNIQENAVNIRTHLEKSKIVNRWLDLID
ncbi:glycosyltransferase [Zunongwangia sp.]|uniref:glycosyltransferase n=1 Tax=Zunongwangia sp. TaxID=1965325 RepID=UPI003AA8E6E4